MKHQTTRLPNRRVGASMIVHGFTLIELMVVIAIIAILAAIAVPSMNDLIKNNRVASAASVFGSAISLARSEAVRRGTTVSLCKSTSSVSACSTTASWNEGWIIFIDANGNGAIDSGDTKIKVWQNPTTATMTGAANSILFSSRGTATGGSGDYTFCVDGKQRKVNLISLGRISLTTGTC